MLRRAASWHVSVRFKSGKPPKASSTDTKFPANESLNTDSLLYSGQNASNEKKAVDKVDNVEKESATPPPKKDLEEKKEKAEIPEDSTVKTSCPELLAIGVESEELLISRKFANPVINLAPNSNKPFSSLAPQNGEILEQLRSLREFSYSSNLSKPVAEKKEKGNPPFPLSALEDSLIQPTLPPIAADIEIARLRQKPRPFEAIPGPSFLQATNRIWKVIPVVVSQVVATTLFTVQNLINTYGKEGRRGAFSPYNQLVQTYGSVVRLHRPLGGDIVLMAVNGETAPLVRQPFSNKATSLFDVLTEYRYCSYYPPEVRLDVEEARKKVKKVDFSIDLYLPQMEEVANLFVKRVALLRDFQQEVNESFSQELLKWSLTNTWFVYTRRKLSYFDDNASVELKIESAKFMKVLNRLIEAIRICETGIQLWRVMPTFTWPSLAESAHSLDRLIIKSTEDAIKELNSNDPTKEGPVSLVQSLFLSGELKTNDYLTQLMDVLVINSAVGAQVAGMVLYHLAKDPVAQKKALDEINNKLPKEGSLKASNLEELTYLKACILESARLKPAIPWLSRVLRDDVTVQGYKIPKDTYIQMVNEVGLEISGKEAFLPERWEKSSEVCGDPLLGLPSWSLSPMINRSIVIQQVTLLCVKILKEFHIAHHQDPLQLDGMVLSAPTTPYYLKLIERHAKVEQVIEKEDSKKEVAKEEKNG